LPADFCYRVAADILKERGVADWYPLPQFAGMSSRFIASTIALAALVIAGCSGSNSSYGASTYDSGYGSTTAADAGGAAAAPAGGANAIASSDSGDQTLGSQIHGLIHEEKQDERVRKAQKTEPLLDSSGFKSMPIDSPAKHKVIEGLTPLTFNRLAHHEKIRYWFPDPYYCKCVYVGDELSYLRYKQAKKDRKQDKEAQAYLIDQENQVDLPMDSEWDPVSAFGMP
jgi:hypothetical protein